MSINDPDRVIGAEMTVPAEKLREGDRYLVGNGAYGEWATIKRLTRVQDGDAEAIRFSWGEGPNDHARRSPDSPVAIRRPHTPKPKAGNE